VRPCDAARLVLPVDVVDWGALSAVRLPLDDWLDDGVMRREVRVGPLDGVRVPSAAGVRVPTRRLGECWPLRASWRRGNSDGLTLRGLLGLVVVVVGLGTCSTPELYPPLAPPPPPEASCLCPQF